MLEPTTHPVELPGENEPVRRRAAERGESPRRSSRLQPPSRTAGEKAMNMPAFWARARRALAAAIFALAVALAACPALARADGDPASDVLVSQSAVPSL